jgi:hypothetical protein
MAIIGAIFPGCHTAFEEELEALMEKHRIFKVDVSRVCDHCFLGNVEVYEELDDDDPRLVDIPRKEAIGVLEKAIEGMPPSVLSAKLRDDE